MEGLERLVAQRVERVLQALGALGARARSGEEVPAFTVTLHLRGGGVLVGQLLDYAPQEAACLSLGRVGPEQAEAVAYVDSTEVVAVTVADATPLLALPGFGRPALGREALGGYASVLAQRLGLPVRFEVEWAGLEGEVARAALETVLSATAQALRALASEPGSREALGRLTHVRFRRGESTGARLEGAVAEVEVNPADPNVSAFALRADLEKGL